MSRNISAGLTPRAAFPCTCNGCRGWVPELYAGASEHTVIEATRNMGSHYFDVDTRRFFRSRVLGWNIAHDGDRYAPWGFLIRESKAAGFDVSDGRAYAVSVWCRFGSLVATWNALVNGEPVEDRDLDRLTSAQAARLLRTGEQAARLAVAACTCHGCAVWGSPWAASAEAVSA